VIAHRRAVVWKNACVRSVPAFLAVAAAVTLTPGPAFALLLQVSAVHGRRAAFANIAGNSVGVLIWGALAAVGVSALVAANQLAYDILRVVGASFLIWLGARALLATRHRAEAADANEPHGLVSPPSASSAVWRAVRRGLVNSLANPKLAVFFVALFPQFLAPGAAVLPTALAMAVVIVTFDFIWYGSVALAVDRFRALLRPRLFRRLEKLSGVVLVAFGVRLATEAR
jgi:threonine/homoserine/homoserine lactone efflux protein